MKVKIGKLPANHSEEQEIKVKIHKHDTWNMDQTLAHIIAPMLRQLKQTNCAAPPVNLEDVPEHLHGGEADFYYERWDWVLDEMIFAFETKTDPSFEDQFFTDEGYDKIGHAKIQKRISNGFNLFGKYYESLWD